MLRVLELFAGIGACSKALTNLGIEHEIVDAVEIDKFAVQSFNAVHGTNFEPQDITKWDKDIECDLIMHGSPCQDFSVAGKGAGGDKDSGTRSSLMYETNESQYACYARGKEGKFTDSRKLSNVWFFEKPKSNKDHPTMKHIGLCAKGVLAMSDPGDIVFDPFSGSGSTMIACEQTGRKCYGCELDPRYVDVIRKRYVKFVYGSEDNWQELTPKEQL